MQREMSWIYQMIDRLDGLTIRQDSYSKSHSFGTRSDLATDFLWPDQVRSFVVVTVYTVKKYLEHHNHTPTPPTLWFGTDSALSTTILIVKE
jgi:hypothetical protein